MRRFSPVAYLSSRAEELTDLTNVVAQVNAHFSDPRNANLRIMGRREALPGSIGWFKASVGS